MRPWPRNHKFDGSPLGEDETYRYFSLLDSFLHYQVATLGETAGFCLDVDVGSTDSDYRGSPEKVANPILTEAKIALKSVLEGRHSASTFSLQLDKISFGNSIALYISNQLKLR